ncbi:MAG TPA: hypothetical protein VHX66_05155, partial [Solirubrobacteraceae bacterium]|nr:hypothetical protein [Solirubrobacteraceae bacterium]
LSLGQRWAYLCGAVQWYGDLLAVLFFVFLLVGAGNIAFSGGLVFRKLTGFLLAAIPVLVVLGLLRAVALLRRGTGATWREALGAFLIWQSTSLTVAIASVQALFAKEAVFLRTPKTQGEHAWSDALKANWAECVLGFAGLVGIAAGLARSSSSYGGPLLAALLLWPTVSFLAAPYNSLSAQRAALPPELRARRRTEHLRYGARLTYAVGGLGLAGGVAALALGLFVPGPATIVPPQIVGPAKGQPVHYGPAPAATSQHSAPDKSARSPRPKRSSSATSTTSASSSTTTTPTTTSSTSTTTATSSSSTTTGSSSSSTTTATSSSSTTAGPSSSSTTTATSSNPTTSSSTTQSTTSDTSTTSTTSP